MPSNPPQIPLPPSFGASSSSNSDSSNNNNNNIPAPSHELMAQIGSILTSVAYDMTNDILLSKVLLSIDSTNIVEASTRPTQLYQYKGFINALGVLSKGDMGSNYFYLGQEEDQRRRPPSVDDADDDGVTYGLANAALFLAQAAVETVQFDICDEVSWEKDVFGKYAIANSCGQGRFAGVSMVAYQDSNPCADQDSIMACPIDPTMTAVAETHGIFAGAPPPLECHPNAMAGGKRFTGAWDPSLSCAGDGCVAYDGQRAGNVDPASVPTANSFGRNDVQGCCWWGRGPFPRGSAGTCMMGKLNYYLGKRAFDEGRMSSARYKEIDFCQDPSAICRGAYEGDPNSNAEIRWIMGMLYWISKVQAYAADGWSYLERLKQFVDGGMIDAEFLEDVSRIVTRGCHDQSGCGNAVSSAERRVKFEKTMYYFANAQYGSLEDTLSPSKRPTLVPTTNSPTTARPTEHATLRATYGISEATFPISPQPAATSSDGEADVPSLDSTLVREEDYKLTSGELAQRLNYSNNYCASSSKEAGAKCASSLRTCNPGDPPCPLGTGCWENIICSIVWSDMEFGPANNEESTPESETLLESPPPESISFPSEINTSKESPSPDESDYSSNAFPCNGACFRPLSVDECTAGGAMIAWLPSCLDIDVGQMCENRGECGGAARAGNNNCPGGMDVLLRVVAEQCGSLLMESSSAGANQPSLPPLIQAITSPAPSSIADYVLDGYDVTTNHNDSNHEDTPHGEFEGFFGSTREQEDSRPGAWWKWEGSNSSMRHCAVSILSLFICTIALALSGV